MDNNLNSEYSLMNLYSPEYKNGAEPYLSLEIKWGMGFVLQFKDQIETFDPDIFYKKDYVNRWSFISFSVMNLDYDEVKICFAFPPNIMSCDMKYKGIQYNQDFTFKMRVG